MRIRLEMPLQSPTHGATPAKQVRFDCDVGFIDCILESAGVSGSAFIKVAHLSSYESSSLSDCAEDVVANVVNQIVGVLD